MQTLKRIGHTIENLPKLSFSFNSKIVLIDDGSEIPINSEFIKDFISQKNCEIVVLRHETSRGPGAAFQTAFQYIAPVVTPRDIVFLLEGDGSSDLNLLPLMTHLIRNPYQEISSVQASPHMHKGGFVGIPRRRILISKTANVVTRWLLNMPGIWSASYFFRAIQGKSVINLQDKFGSQVLSCDGFEALVELTWKTSRLDPPIIEIPCVVNCKEKLTPSTMKVIRVSFRYFRFLAMTVLNKSR